MNNQEKQSYKQFQDEPQNNSRVELKLKKDQSFQVEKNAEK